jgi:hypothetical protein
MSTSDKIAVVVLGVTAFGCVGTWLAVPGLHRWANKSRRLIAFGAILLAVSIIFWLQSKGDSIGPKAGDALPQMQPKPGQPMQADGDPGISDAQTSFGKNSPNVKSSGSGPVTVTIQDHTRPMLPLAKPAKKEK